MSDKDSWETPQDLYEELDIEFNFLIDACATTENRKAPIHLCDMLSLNSFEDLEHNLLDELADHAEAITYGIDSIYEEVHYDNTDLVSEMIQERFFENYADEFSIFMNPPYSDKGPFLHRAWEFSKHMKVVCLVPENILTAKYMDIFDKCTEGSFRDWKEGLTIRHMKRRVKFTHPTLKSSSPNFGCMLLIMDRRGLEDA